MLKDVMAFVHADVDRTPHVVAALAVAKAHDALLRGVCAVDLPPTPAFVEAPLGMELLEQELERRRAAARKLEASFEATAKQAGVTAEWRTIEGAPLSIAQEYGRAADLVVLCQADPEAGGAADDVEELALSLGGRHW